MAKRQPTTHSRRGFMHACLALPAPLVLAACGGEPAAGARRQVAGVQATPEPATRAAPAPPPEATTAPEPGTAAQPPALAATPACADADSVTLPQTEGPYFKPSSPSRAALLEPGATGTRLVISGRVLTTDCRPVARALLDFWQADDRGNYDNAGYRLRGHQFADDVGRYRLETIVPGLYPGRTRHIHVKVQGPGRPVLTTQLYFPGEPRNATDAVYNAKLVLRMQDASDGKLATFDFVLAAA